MTESKDPSRKRKFVAALAGKPGIARQAREAVASAVRGTSPNSSKPVNVCNIDPIDYEKFIENNRSEINKDESCDLVLFPRGDIEISSVSPKHRITRAGVLEQTLDEAGSSLFSKQCLKTYTNDYTLIKFKNATFGGHCSKNDQLVSELEHLKHEVDMQLDLKKNLEPVPKTSAKSVSIKEGYLLIFQSVSSCDIEQLSSKAFKKRYCILSRELDNICRFEFLKDTSKLSSVYNSNNITTNGKTSKLKVFIDQQTRCEKLDKKTKSYLWLTFSDDIVQSANVYLCAENEQILNLWLSTLKSCIEECRKFLEKTNAEETTSLSSLETNLNDSRNPKISQTEKPSPPDYYKFLALNIDDLQNQLKNRSSNAFSLYSDIEEPSTSTNLSTFYSDNIEPVELKHGIRFLVECKNLKVHLPIPDEDSILTSQIEPLFASIFLLDAKTGRRVSETFHFDVNSTSLKSKLFKQIASRSNSLQSQNSWSETGSVGTQSSEKKKIEKALFSIDRPHPDLYLILRIDKILQCGVQAGQEPYIKQDAKLAAKLKKNLPLACSRLGRYRMPFAWTYKQVFQKFITGTEDAQNVLPLYKQDQEKLSDEEVFKLLTESRKNEKPKLVSIPEAAVTIFVDVAIKPEKIQNCLTSSGLPILPKNNENLTISTREVDYFKEETKNVEINTTLTKDQNYFLTDLEPHLEYSNILYCYPISLKYDSQRTFSKARNISCIVEFRDSDEFSSNPKPLRKIFGQTGFDKDQSISRSNSTVCHHVTFPQFYDQIKVELPSALHERHHLLFTFVHIGLDSALSQNANKANGKKEHNFESSVGFAWVPLIKNGKLNINDEVSLGVAASLPDGYLKYSSMGFNKGHTGPDIKWVENGRPLFRVKFKLNSTVFSTDPAIQSFFFDCQRLQNMGTLPDVCENTKAIITNDKSIIDISQLMFEHIDLLKAETIIEFLPTLLNQLFEVISLSNFDESAIKTLKSIDKILNVVTNCEKDSLLHAYIKFYFKLAENPNAVHEVIIRSLKLIFDAEHSDSILETFMTNLWFYFDISGKDMLLRLIKTNQVTANRHDRVSESFVRDLENLVANITSNICRYYKMYRKACKLACASLANYLKICLSVLDRSMVFKLIQNSMATLNAYDFQTIKEYKIDFITSLCSHEYFLHLSLPILITKDEKLFNYVPNEGWKRRYCSNNTNNTNGPFIPSMTSRGLLHRLFSLSSGMFSVSSNISSSYKEAELSTSGSISFVAHELRLSDEFMKHHYLVGLLLRLLKENFFESKEIRRKTIMAVRNLLAKHSFDDRLDKKRLQKVALLYFPLVPLIIEFLPSIETDEENLNQLEKRQSTDLNSIVSVSTNNIKGAKMKNGPRPCSSLSDVLGSKPNDRHLSVLNRRNETGGGSATPSVSETSGTTRSAKTSSSAFSDGTNSQCNDSASATGGASLQQSESTVKPGSETESTSLQTTTTLHVLSCSKFDEQELGDLLLCFAFVIKHVPEDILDYTWQQWTEIELDSFLCLLKMCIYRFRYKGMQTILKSHQKAKTTTKKKTRFSIVHNKLDEDESVLKKINERHLSIDNIDFLALDENRNKTAHPFRVVRDSNLAQDILCVVLYRLNQFVMSQQTHLKSSTACLRKIFNLYLDLIDKKSSNDLVLKVFLALQFFVKMHSKVFLECSETFCLDLCKQLLICCNWTSIDVQKEACSFIYLLMRLDFENTNKRHFKQLNQRIIVAMSQLLGEGCDLNNSDFDQSLGILINFATLDRYPISFGVEVKETIRRIRTVLIATSQLIDYADDSDMLADLQCSLADGYAQSPELKKTWLLNLARHQKRFDRWAEAAQCYLRVAHLIYEQLRRTGKYKFDIDVLQIFPFAKYNLTESIDSSLIESHGYIEEDLVEQINNFASCTLKSRRFETLSIAYRIIIPVYEQKENYEALASLYTTLHDAYAKLAIMKKSRRRVRDTYFRVLLLSVTHFEQQHNVDYIYRENNAVSLTEMSERMLKQFSGKFGQNVVKILTESAQVDLESLDSNHAYIQITHVDPYPKQTPGTCTISPIGINEFSFDAPFCKIGKSLQATQVTDQWRRRTILKTARPLPDVTRRVPVVALRSLELNPLQTALEELETRCAELERCLRADPIDVKMLQLLLQGSVSATVNSGPLAYAEGFCRKDEVEKYGLSQWDKLKETFKKFVATCYDALEANEKLIKSDQVDYHQSLVDHFRELVQKMNTLFNDNMLPLHFLGPPANLDDQEGKDSVDSVQKLKCPTTVLNYISGTS